MAHSSWQDNTGLVIAKEATTKKAQEELPKMNVSRCHTLGNATLQPLSADLW